MAPFISLDGIDGTGKTTQCRSLVQWLTVSGIATELYRDPGGTVIGDKLRAILLDSKDEISARAEALLFMASRAELVSRLIRPKLEQGIAIVCDRFITANVVYQGYAGGLNPDDLWRIGRFCTNNLLPDLTLILDLPVEKAIERRGRTADRMESRGIEYLTKVRDGFLNEAGKNVDSFVVIDASGNQQEVEVLIRDAVSHFLGKKALLPRPRS